MYLKPPNHILTYRHSLKKWCRGYGQISQEVLKNKTEYEPLLDIIERRRLEARRSIMVQVKGPQSAADLYSYCTSNFGPVKGMHFYKNHFTKAFSNFYIVEFQNESCVSDVMKNGSHAEIESGSQPVPVTSPFLWLSGGRTPSKPASLPPEQPPVFDGPPEERIPASGCLVSDQIYKLWKSVEISDSDARCRFLVCRQVELAVQGMFCHASVLPFGSSVNGFGQIHGDQDMILSLDPQPQKDRKSRLIFHSKSSVYGGDRAQIRRYCDQISNMIQVFLPGCQDVQKILYARVPIIKYRQELTGIDCDLSMTSSSGLYMSCLLHVWGGSDWRVRPLVAVVKKWAKSQKLVKDVRPTNYFTNFSLVMLVVCYLQQVHTMLPTVEKLQEFSSDKDLYVCEDGVTVQFLHGVTPHLRTFNSCFDSHISLFELLRGFFEFYSEADFSASCFNPITGSTQTKNKLWPKSSALDIVNPLEPELNVSYNVSPPAVKMFKERCIESRKKCEKYSKLSEEFDLSDLFGKEKDSVLSMPRILDVGLGREVKKSAKSKFDNQTRTKHKETSFDLNKVFSEKSEPQKEIHEEEKRKKLHQEKFLRGPREKPVFKQNL